ncbi:MAG TPA: protocatechuate 3,4-dioxygenase subunit alpha [Candidatus Sulfotelmatobacter sp.]|jgi:protocatechuate 3,4-dioxygenase alpha subunit|nr:protocatechuate 3,4-dioxygenase subunit alpha [Candidatus Sulfotelmatobacter sp.]
MSLQATTSQTVGPFFDIGLRWLHRDNLAAEGVSGERVTIQGRVLDGDGVPVPDALLEIWQANAHGKYAHPEDKQDKPLEAAFHGYGRVPVNKEGVFRFVTIKPGPVPGPDGKDQAPHLLISVFLRGVLRRLVTRMYFPDDPRNADDCILNLVEGARRSTLTAKKVAGQPGALEWNIVLQGVDETVFFDLGL